MFIVSLGLLISGSTEHQKSLKPIFRPCQTIPVFINDQTHSPVFRIDLSKALAEVAGLSGTKFTINGYTAEMPTTPFFPKYRDREYLIVALIDRAESNIFPSKDAVAATTYFTSNFEGRRKRIGVIVIDRLAYESFDNDLFKTRSKLTILRHELGHVIGFSHSKGMNLMNARVLAIPLNLLQTSWPKVASIPSRCGKG